MRAVTHKHGSQEHIEHPLQATQFNWVEHKCVQESKSEILQHPAHRDSLMQWTGSKVCRIDMRSILTQVKNRADILRSRLLQDTHLPSI